MKSSVIALGLTLLAASFAGTASLQAQTRAPFVVCIDPGHPSETARGASANGLVENHLNWLIAVKLANKLNARGIAWVSTKPTENKLVTNKNRAEVANGRNRYKVPCALFIRLHCDAGSGSGYSWYYPDRAARKAGGYGPPPDVQRSSRSAAYILNEAMRPILQGDLPANSVKTDAATGVGGRQGGVLTGSIFSRVPTALIEMCFITNRRDARFIASERGQNKMADALVAGITAWRARWTRGEG